MGDNMLPFLAMVLVQIGFAGMNITSKLAMDSGMNPLVLVSYRQLFASVFLLPVAFFLERKTRPAINRSILLEILLCSVLGATGNQLLFFLGLKLSTPTIASALNNVLPAITFILAVPFRLERVGWKEKWGQAKLIGTMVCVGGAMILSFYHGGVILIGESHLHFKLETTNPSLQQCSNSFIGPMLVIASCICWAGWLIVQARLSERFPAPYTTTGLMCFMASIQCVMAGAFSERRVSGWSLSSHARLIASVYAGVVGSALAYCLMSWCIQRKGPLYVSVFSPLLLVIVAVLSWALLQETLYTGTWVLCFSLLLVWVWTRGLFIAVGVVWWCVWFRLLGSLLIVVGLYAVLWGKDCEALESRKKVENGGEEKEGGEKGENV